ncbi:cysteine desulfurase family protein [Apibacter raozihei]|uniref:cysteine desulfurase family protein n=1 Tax=Apibacter raozihei TaxID=2500547 RepID=UPI000FE2E4B7|nr:cysteine desulfurase family protein [Apibacter raozihei]
MKKIYLDSAASTIIDHRVIDAMTESLKDDFGNPSSIHSFGQEGKSKIESVRKFIARSLGVSSGEIIFTSCGTESNNLIIRSSVENLGIKRIITSPLEHKCVTETVRDIKEKHPELEILFIPVKNAQGDLDLDFLEELLQDSVPTLVSIMHANNEVGNLIDLKEVAVLCKNNNALFHSDTVQTVGHYPLNFSEIPIDFASCSAHKFHGPKGAGFAFIRKASHLKGITTGGAQERNMRAGTENIYGIIGLGKSLELALNELNERRKIIEDLKVYTLESLSKKIPGVKFNGYSNVMDKSIYTLISVLLPFPNTMVGFQLDMKGIAVSQGSACASGAAKPSNTMLQLYSLEDLKDTTTLRISFSHYNTKEEIDELIAVLVDIYEKSTVTS